MSQPLPFHPDDIDAVLFDLDGTLIDSDDEEVDRWAHRIARLYSAPPKATRAARKLVMALESPVNALFTALDLVGLDTPVVRLMITLQGTKSTEHLPPVDGAVPLIDQLAARYKLALVSTRTVEEGQAFLASIGSLPRSFFLLLLLALPLSSESIGAKWIGYLMIVGGLITLALVALLALVLWKYGVDQALRFVNTFRGRGEVDRESRSETAAMPPYNSRSEDELIPKQTEFSPQNG